MLADSGYVGQPFAQGVQDTLGEAVTVQIAKRNELHKFAVIPKRWVVERSFAWLEKKSALVEELRAMAQHQLAFHSLGLLGDAAQKIVNTFLEIWGQ